jgi:hypothetical protein
VLWSAAEFLGRHVLYWWWYLPECKSPNKQSSLLIYRTNNSKGQCTNGSVGKEIKSWIDRHLGLVIGLAAGIGGIIVLLILCCCWRSYRRRSKQRKYAKQIATGPPPPPPHRSTRGHHHGPPNPNAPGNVPMRQTGPSPMQGQWGPNPNHGPPPMQSPPPLYHRSSVRYA